MIYNNEQLSNVIKMLYRLQLTSKNDKHVPYYPKKIKMNGNWKQQRRLDCKLWSFYYPYITDIAKLAKIVKQGNVDQS